MANNMDIILQERSQILRCWFELIIKNHDSLAELITTEMVIPL